MDQNRKNRIPSKRKDVWSHAITYSTSVQTGEEVFVFLIHLPPVCRRGYSAPPVRSIIMLLMFLPWSTDTVGHQIPKMCKCRHKVFPPQTTQRSVNACVLQRPTGMSSHEQRLLLFFRFLAYKRTRSCLIKHIKHLVVGEVYCARRKM